MASSSLRRRVLACAVGVAVFAGVPATAVAAGPGTDTHRLQQAKDRVAADRVALDKARAELTHAQDRLHVVVDRARRTVGRYRTYMAQLAVAEQAADKARAHLAAAARDVAVQRATVDQFIRASYIAGGPLTSVAVVLGPGGAGAILDRASMLNAVSTDQHRMLARLDAAEQRRTTRALRADSAARVAERLAFEAASARRAAMDALASQQAVIDEVTKARTALAKRLVAHQLKVSTIVSEQAMAAVMAKALAQLAAEDAAQRAILLAGWHDIEAVGAALPWATVKQGQIALRAARRQLGTPYSWGGGDVNGATFGSVNVEGNPAGLHTAGFDCSGLTLFAWSKAGFALDHYTGYQWIEGHHVTPAHMRPGDLVFFATDVTDPSTIHHVGIYAGGDRMIDAPHTGAVVRYDSVFEPGFIGAVRP